MYEGNISTIRRIVERLNARDPEGSFPMLDPDLDWVSTFASLEGGSYRGHAGWARYLADLDAQWTGFTINPEEYLDPDDETVILIARAQARGRESGIAIETRIWTVTKLREGLLVWARTFLDAAEAFHAAGVVQDSDAGDDPLVTRLPLDAAPSSPSDRLEPDTR